MPSTLPRPTLTPRRTRRPNHPAADTTSLPLGLTAHRPLTAREERTLARRAQRGDRASRDQLLLANVRLVRTIARQYLVKGLLDLDDLAHEGLLGLGRAIEKFDPARGTRFSTYATWWISQSIQRAVARQSRTIRLPEHAHVLARRLGRARADLVASLGHLPTERELARHTGLTSTVIRAITTADTTPTSLQTPIGHDGTGALADLLTHDAIDVEAHAEADTLHTELCRLLETLPPRHADILRRRYGLDGRAQEPYATIAADYGVSGERIRQIERAALQRLRPLARRRLHGYLAETPDEPR